MLGIVSLQNDPARLLPSPRPAGHLGQQLKGPFPGPEIES
jgi:hypothetical protein